MKTKTKALLDAGSKLEAAMINLLDAKPRDMTRHAEHAQEALDAWRAAMLTAEADSGE